LPADLREIDAADGDIAAMGPDSIQMRAMRQLAFVCPPNPLMGGGIGQLTLNLRATPMYGNRQTFQRNDSLLIYWEGNPTTLTGANGVTFSYYDSVGAVTPLPAQVAQIQIVLRARTTSPIRGADGVQAYKVDSVVTRVALRNNPRCGPGSAPPRSCG